MAESFKFPNGGYEVNIVRKKEILDCIEKNITDKDVALAVVTQCEVDAASFLKDGKWSSIPFIGNLRINKRLQYEKAEEQRKMIEEAKANLGKEEYYLFRKQLGKENTNRARNERYYNYVVSMAANRNRKLYKELCTVKGEQIARLVMYANSTIIAIDNEYINIIEDNDKEL